MRVRSGPHVNRDGGSKHDRNRARARETHVPIRPRRRPCDRAQERETERQLLLRYHREGDLAAREELVERFLPLARDLALRYSYTDEPFDDLLQVACLGLIKAIDRFEPGRGTKFTSYAAPDHPRAS